MNGVDQTSNGKAKKEKVIRLSFTQKTKLVEFITANLSRYKQTRPNTEVVAAESSAALKFLVTKGHVQGVRRDEEINLDWPKGSSGGGGVRRHGGGRLNAIRWGRQLRTSRCIAKMMYDMYESCPDQILKDAEITFEELQSKTIDQLIEEAIDLQEQKQADKKSSAAKTTAGALAQFGS